MTISNKHGKIITNLETWKEGFLEVDKDHWKEGRSAHSLALHFTNPSVEHSVGQRDLNKYLEKIGFKGVIFEGGEIEHESRFDSYSGRGRMQDLFIKARCEDKLLAIRIEAKVDETFDKDIIKAFLSKEKEFAKNNRSKALIRLRELCNKFYNLEPDSEELKGIRYQLLYYLAGSITEAKKMNGIAIMPVFVYHTGKYNTKKGERNKNDYKSFMNSLGFKSIQSSDNSLLYKNEFDGTKVYSTYIEIDLK